MCGQSLDIIEEVNPAVARIVFGKNAVTTVVATDAVHEANASVCKTVRVRCLVGIARGDNNSSYRGARDLLELVISEEPLIQVPRSRKAALWDTFDTCFEENS